MAASRARRMIAMWARRSQRSSKTVNAAAAAQARRALTQLHRALSDLPAPWSVLCSRRPSGDGPPWVKYLAIHPGKGIALVDVIPARPDRAIAPLVEFLIGTGLAAFADGDPPIVALAVDLDDVSNVGVQLIEAFADFPPCGIRNPNWPEALVDLLMMTPGLLLARLGHAAEDAARRTRVASPPAMPDWIETEPAATAPLRPRESMGIGKRRIAARIAAAFAALIAAPRWMVARSAAVARRAGHAAS